MEISFTPREQQILNLIIEEKSNVAIASELGISEKTVESHRKNLYLKTGSRTVVGLVKYVLGLSSQNEKRK